MNTLSAIFVAAQMVGSVNCMTPEANIAFVEHNHPGATHVTLRGDQMDRARAMIKAPILNDSTLAQAWSHPSKENIWVILFHQRGGAMCRRGWVTISPDLYAGVMEGQES